MPIINSRDSIIFLSSNLQRINVLLDLIITSLFPGDSYCLYPALFAFSSPSLRRFFWWSSLLLLCGAITKIASIRNMRPLSDLKKGTQSSLYVLFAHFAYFCPPLVLWLSGLNYDAPSLGHSVDWRPEVFERRCLWPISCTKSSLKLHGLGELALGASRSPAPCSGSPSAGCWLSGPGGIQPGPCTAQDRAGDTLSSWVLAATQPNL